MLLVLSETPILITKAPEAPREPGARMAFQFWADLGLTVPLIKLGDLWFRVYGGLQP